MTLPPRILTVLLPGALCAGCAGAGGDYPSLAIRDVERQYGRFLPTEGARSGPTPAEVPAPVPPVAGSAAIAALVDDAQGSHARFEQREDSVAAQVGAARGRGIDSDARAAALTALSDLTALRSATAVPLGDLDLLAAEAATTFAPTGDIDAARALVLALVEHQDAVLAELWTEMDR
ncbi:hypothetical protein SAMN04515621_0178 [Erythrobacter sp. HL-111]|nr:MAG: hypothetical protein HLUCCO15_06060 [Erythrobacteraceae bacterium HL-111]SDR71961.1 hypothetical protein SAMN04515621_0178 [Erythrobacter sp. HL-111]